MLLPSDADLIVRSTCILVLQYSQVVGIHVLLGHLVSFQLASKSHNTKQHCRIRRTNRLSTTFRCTDPQMEQIFSQLTHVTLCIFSNQSQTC